jgi:hypothetical protein
MRGCTSGRPERDASLQETAVEHQLRRAILAAVFRVGYVLGDVPALRGCCASLSMTMLASSGLTTIRMLERPRWVW